MHILNIYILEIKYFSKYICIYYQYINTFQNTYTYTQHIYYQIINTFQI